jgi:hypothetical protein
MKEKSFLIFVWRHLWYARVSLEGMDTTSNTTLCAGVDAFTASWYGEVAYCAPPIAMMTRVIAKIEVSWMTGVLLVPLWRGAKSWSHSFPDGPTTRSGRSSGS